MAARKYKPALIELISQGSLKPDVKGSLNTPKWFYGKKPAVLDESDGQVAKDSSGPDGSAKVAASATSGIEVQASRRWLFQQRKNSKFSMENGLLSVSAPLWIFGLVGLALIFSFLLMYRLGQSFGSAKPANFQPRATADAQPGKKLEDVVKSPARNDVLSFQRASQPGPAVRAELKLPKAQGESVRSSRASLPLLVESKRTESAGIQDESSVASGICWIMCGHDSSRELRPVQEYFAKRGFATEIGRFNNRYVLYSQTAFESSKNAEAIKLKNRIAQLGLYYNSEKKKGAASFSADTFKSAYPVNRQRISSISH